MKLLSLERFVLYGVMLKIYLIFILSGLPKLFYPHYHHLLFCDCSFIFFNFYHSKYTSYVAKCVEYIVVKMVSIYKYIAI